MNKVEINTEYINQNFDEDYAIKLTNGYFFWNEEGKTLEDKKKKKEEEEAKKKAEKEKNSKKDKEKKKKKDKKKDKEEKEIKKPLLSEISDK